ncbi:hypothetical protein NQ317_017780 [Molorchus minor]|uniref:Uncharacterized protein n=1 Tax=Molorchus minor TaxID=1323400 RepID=A0ABQ9K0J9_9CUCU|nr:hypothetical protein NQ317_017780 [Molorchus minor]
MLHAGCRASLGLKPRGNCYDSIELDIGKLPISDCLKSPTNGYMKLLALTSCVGQLFSNLNERKQ